MGVIWLSYKKLNVKKWLEMGNPRKKLDQFAIHPEFGAQFKPLAELTTPFQSQTHHT